MTSEQARKIIADHPNAISFVKSSHLEELSPLVEVHIEVVTVQKKDFHALQGNVYYPRKETTDRFGNAAGISFADVEVSTRREGEATVGKAYPQEVGPDGKMIKWAPAEYEFDPELRAEEDILRDTRNKYTNEKSKRLLVLNYKKVARRRADTGARAAAIISAIGMPTGFRDLFNSNDPETAEREFLFSRIIANSKNERVLQAGLDAMFGKAEQLYGPNAAQKVIEGDVEQPEEVTEEFEDVPFEESEEKQASDQARKDIQVQLEQYLNAINWAPTQAKQIKAWVDDEKMSLEELDEKLTMVKTRYEQKMQKQGARS